MMCARKPEPIIIAGSERGGTTWVLDILVDANGYRNIFEPLQPLGVVEAAPFAYRYVRKDNTEPELAEFMDAVFLGQTRTLWTDYRIRPDKFAP